MNHRPSPILGFMAVAALAAASLSFCSPPAVAAAPAALAVAEADGQRVYLYEIAGPCVGGAKLAEHVSKAGEKTPGCYKVHVGPQGAVVLVSYLDGDRDNIPVAAFKPVESL